MLNNKGFDLWADDYDKSVGLSDDDGTYPFAGYKNILNEIYNRILNASAKTVIATYSLHHLTDLQKVTFIGSLLQLLNDEGCIYIGDVAFENRAALQKCMDEAGDEWDDDEIYFVIEELKTHFPEIQFKQLSSCAGLISLHR